MHGECVPCRGRESEACPGNPHRLQADQSHHTFLFELFGSEGGVRYLASVQILYDTGEEGGVKLLDIEDAAVRLCSAGGEAGAEIGGLGCEERFVDVEGFGEGPDLDGHGFAVKVAVMG